MAVVEAPRTTRVVDVVQRRVAPSLRRQSALGLLVVLELAWLGGQSHLHGSLRWGPLALVVVAHLCLVAVERRDPRLDPRQVVGAVAIVAVGAALLTPFGSRDFSIYAMYGRMVTFHHVNPHTATPASVGPDPFLAHVAPPWHDDQTLYGPAFTALSALGAVGFGASPLLARLYFQGLAAGSLVLIARILRRRRVSTSVLVLVGLSPVLVATVNGAHNDLLVGVLALAGIDRATRGRVTGAAVLLALASLVKVSALPVAGAAFLALVLTRRWRLVARASTVYTAVVGLGYVVVGGAAALEPLTSVGERMSRASLWNSLATLELISPAGDPAHLAAGCLALGGLVVAACFVRGDPPVRPEAIAALATAFGVLFCFTSGYVLPWYPAAYLPVSALCLGSAPRRALAVGSLALLGAYVQPPGWSPAELALAPEAAVAAGVVLGLCAAAVVAWAVSAGRGRAGPPEGAATLGR